MPGWLLNRLSLNVKKTKYIVFHAINKAIDGSFSELHIDGIGIERVLSYDFLGIHFNEHMLWKTHIDTIGSKLYKLSGALNRLKRFLPEYVLCTLYCSMVHSWTKVYRIFFQRTVTSRWRGKSTICQFRNGNTSYFYTFVKCHRHRRNGHGPVPLNNEQRFKIAMSTYTRPAHHCDQRWTCVLTALRDSHSWSNLQQLQLRQLSPKLTRFHGIVKFYSFFIHYIEETKPGHQQFHSISHHE